LNRRLNPFVATPAKAYEIVQMVSFFGPVHAEYRVRYFVVYIQSPFVFLRAFATNLANAVALPGKFSGLFPQAAIPSLALAPEASFKHGVIGAPKKITSAFVIAEESVLSECFAREYTQEFSTLGASPIHAGFFIFKSTGNAAKFLFCATRVRIKNHSACGAGYFYIRSLAFFGTVLGVMAWRALHGNSALHTSRPMGFYAHGPATSFLPLA
jgi:hypothetical protein